MVDKRYSSTHFDPVRTIAVLADKIRNAAGASSNYELVVKHRKLGGNGPIMANALASLGLDVTYIGNLGYPTIHPVFQEFATRARVINIAEPGHTDALEFADGKLMLGKHETLNDVNWENLVGRRRPRRALAADRRRQADRAGQLDDAPPDEPDLGAAARRGPPPGRAAGADPVHRPGGPGEADPRGHPARADAADPISGRGRRHPRPEPQGSGRDRGRAGIAGPERPRGDDRSRRGGDPRDARPRLRRHPPPRRRGGGDPRPELPGSPGRSSSTP